jgi:hypothetical protein
MTQAITLVETFPEASGIIHRFHQANDTHQEDNSLAHFDRTLAELEADAGRFPTGGLTHQHTPRGLHALSDWLNRPKIPYRGSKGTLPMFLANDLYKASLVEFLEPPTAPTK